MDSISYYLQTARTASLGGLHLRPVAWGSPHLRRAQLCQFRPRRADHVGRLFPVSVHGRALRPAPVRRHSPCARPDGMPGPRNGFLRVPPHPQGEPSDAAHRGDGPLRLSAQRRPVLLGRRGEDLRPRGNAGMRFFGSTSRPRRWPHRRQILCYGRGVPALLKSRLGKSMRALSDNLDLARISGIDTKRAILAAWVISAVLAAIGGILLALDTNLSPEMGIINLIKAFAATLIGGVGNLWGALLGGLLWPGGKAWGALIRRATGRNRLRHHGDHPAGATLRDRRGEERLRWTCSFTSPSSSPSMPSSR